jgi:predicted GTPase
MQNGFTPEAVSQLNDAYDRQLNDALARLGKVNVLIAGSSGVGKSTLINSIFGSQVAKTGVGRAVTQSIDRYDPPNSTLRIYDTRGFEIKNSEVTVAAVQGEVRRLRTTTDPNDQIHIAWLCILEHAHRVEDVHTSFLRMLASENIPALVVITQSFQNEEMLSAVKSLAVPNRGVHQVLAEKKSIQNHAIHPFGVQELVDATLKLLPEAQKAAFVAAQKARWDIKEKSAVDAITAAAVAAGTSAFIPVPGGHSVALASIQMALMARINASLGLTPEMTGGKDFVKGFLGMTAAHMGGQAAFGLAISEALKFIPGLGTIGAGIIGGSIAAPITFAFGHAYLDSIKQYARDDLPLPPPEQMAGMLAANKDRYREMAQRTQ